MEIEDLQPKPVPASLPITSGQLDLYLKVHNAKHPCEACGVDSWEMCPEGDGAIGLARGVVWLACNRCNALRTFLRPPIVAWLKEARGG